MESIVIDHDRCILCGACATVCVRQIIDASGSALKLVSPENCIFCGHCKAVCPEDAIEIPSLAEEEFVLAPQKENFLSPEDLLAFFRSRRSTRIYRDKAIEKEKLVQIIEAGRFAPTGGNLQALRYAVAHTPEMMREIRRLAINSLSNLADRMAGADSGQPMEGAAALHGQIRQNYAQTLKEMARRYDQGVDRLLWDAPVLIVPNFSNLPASMSAFLRCRWF